MVDYDVASIGIIRQALHHGVVCGPRHVCTAEGACAEDLALGLPAAMADPSAAGAFQAQYSHDFDGASYKVRRCRLNR